MENFFNNAPYLFNTSGYLNCIPNIGLQKMTIDKNIFIQYI